jgi:uncharacterized membrane protein
LLQVHNMLSTRLPRTSIVNIEINMFWDGLFHAFTWIMTVAGLASLWSTVRRRDVVLSTRALVGSLLLGWGTFNLVEGIIDHQILNIHHVVEGPNYLAYDLAFLGFSVVLVVVGGSLIRTAILNTGVEAAVK